MYKCPMTKKVLKVLEYLVEERTPVGVSQISSALSINKSTLFGILKALDEEGYVIKDRATKTYAAGEALIKLSKPSFRRPDIAGLARPFLKRLTAVTGETAFLGLREDSFMKVVAVVESQKAIRVSSRLGTKLPLVAGAFGKAFLSAVSEGELFELLEKTGLPRFTDSTNQQMGLFLQELRRTKTLGYASDMEEFVGGVAGLAAPVTAGGQALGAVWVAGFSASIQSLQLFSIIRCLRETAQSIGATIGSHSAFYAPSRTAGMLDTSSRNSEGAREGALSESFSRRPPSIQRHHGMVLDEGPGCG
jgi:IclR family KDG regulon transcriptional repressor